MQNRRGFSTVHFADRLVSLVNAKCSCIVVGLDTDPERLPKGLVPTIKGGGRAVERALAKAQGTFNRVIIDAVRDVAVGVKLQIAFYEMLGPEGIRVYLDSIRYAKERGLIVIGDIKRGDIGTTATAYAKAHLAMADAVDAVTVNPYMGSDSIYPFVELAKKHNQGVFVLLRTSNPSSCEFQDLSVEKDGKRQALFNVVAEKVRQWGQDLNGACGYSLVGAVVGATFPDEGKKLRAAMPSTFFLVPGYGAQGASAHDVSMCFDREGSGAIVNASRSIIYAFEKARKRASLDSVGRYAKNAAEKMRDDINEAVATRKTH